MWKIHNCPDWCVDVAARRKKERAAWLRFMSGKRY